MYVPPFTVTDEITSLIADIAEKVGHLSATTENLPAPHLRKEIVSRPFSRHLL